MIRSDYYSVKEAAQILNVSDKTVRRRITDKELEAVWHDGGPGMSQWLIPKSVIDTAIATVDTTLLTRQISPQELQQQIRTAIREELQSIIHAEMENYQDTTKKDFENMTAKITTVIENQSETIGSRLDRLQKKPWWKLW